MVDLFQTDHCHELIFVSLLPLKDVSVGREKSLQWMSHLMLK